MRMSRMQLAGLLLFLGGLAFVIGIPMAETLYPGYNVNANYISDLGATCLGPPVVPVDMGCVIEQPASAVFTATLVIAGGLGVVATYLLFPLIGSRKVTVLLGLCTLGVMLIGIFNEAIFGALHMVATATAFVTGALAAIASYRLVRAPMNYVFLALGVITLVMIPIRYWASPYIFGSSALSTPIGPGGMERLIAYPIAVFFMAFGGALVTSIDTVTAQSRLPAGPDVAVEGAGANAPLPGR